MDRFGVKISVVGAIFLVGILSCSKVMMTGRQQLNLVSDKQVVDLGKQSYEEFMAQANVSTNVSYKNSVNRVGERLTSAVMSYLKSSGMEKEISNFSWEFKVVKDNQVNAFCLPSGKIVFYEGIMPFCSNETLVAVVMSHEIAHVVAKHAQERVSQQMLASLGAGVLNGLLNTKSESTRQVAQMIYGLGANVGVMLPYSRKQEFEADKLGLLFMHMAGYDVNQAVEFWTSMAAKGGGATPEFLSTHPSDGSRIESIRKAIFEIQSKK